MSIDGLLQSIRLERTETSRANAPIVALAPTIDVFVLALVTGPIARTGMAGVAYTVLALCVLAFSGTYRPRLAPEVTSEILPLVGRLSAPLVAVAALGSTSPDIHRLLRVAPVLFAGVIAGRALSYALVRVTRARGYALPEPTLIVGAGNLGEQAARILDEHPEFGLSPVGFLDTIDDHDLSLPLLGPVDRLEAVVREFGVKRVIVAFGAARETELIPVLRACSVTDVEVHVLPRFFDLGISGANSSIEDVWGLPLVRVQRPAARSRYRFIKRSADIVAAVIGLAFASPIMGALALAVKLSSPGPVLFRQKRVGYHGEMVEIMKFRTCLVNGDSDTCWSVDGTERVTPIGKFLRKTGFDELPQLFNILRGEMSLVGPRPERPHFSEQFSVAVPGYEDRLRVLPGLTGWAQVHGLRGDTSIEDRARFDNHYIEHWSPWRDLVIVGRTVTAVIRRVFS